MEITTKSLLFEQIGWKMQVKDKRFNITNLVQEVPVGGCFVHEKRYFMVLQTYDRYIGAVDLQTAQTTTIMNNTLVQYVKAHVVIED